MITGSAQLLSDATGNFIWTKSGKVAAPGASQGVPEVVSEIIGGTVGGTYGETLESLGDDKKPKQGNEDMKIDIKRRHIFYSLKNNVGILLISAPGIAIINLLNEGGWVEYAYGMSPVIVITAGRFLYFLWRTQNNRIP